MKLTGYLYGHYDSRGGTAFIVAPHTDEGKQKADREYATIVMGWDLDEVPGLKDSIDGDCFGKATLDTPFTQADMDALPKGIDLECTNPFGNEEDDDNWNVFVQRDSLAKDDTSDYHIESDEADVGAGCGEEFLSGKSEHPGGFQLVHARMTQPPADCVLPRWTDDAFGFYLVN